jgi:hypothetical protein
MRTHTAFIHTKPDGRLRAGAKDEKRSKHQLKRQAKLKKKESISAARKNRKGKSATSDSCETDSDDEETHEELKDTGHGYGGTDADGRDDVNECEEGIEKDKDAGSKHEKNCRDKKENGGTRSVTRNDDTCGQDNAHAGEETEAGEKSSVKQIDNATCGQSGHDPHSDPGKNGNGGSGMRCAARSEGPRSGDAESHEEAGPNEEGDEVEYDQDDPDAYLARKDAETLRKRGKASTPCSAGGPEVEEYNEDTPDAFLAKKDAETMCKKAAVEEEMYGKMQSLSLHEQQWSHTRASDLHTDDACPGMGPADVDATVHNMHADRDKDERGARSEREADSTVKDALHDSEENASSECGGERGKRNGCDVNEHSSAREEEVPGDECAGGNDGGAERGNRDSSNVIENENARESGEKCAGENESGDNDEDDGGEEDGVQPWQKTKENRSGDMSVGMQKVLEEERHSCGLRMCLCELLKVLVVYV